MKKWLNKQIIKWLEHGIYDISTSGKTWFITMTDEIVNELKKKTITKGQAIKLYNIALEEGSYYWENKFLEKLK